MASPPAPSDPHGSIEGLSFHGQDVRRLVESIRADERIRHISTAFLPDREAVIAATHRLRWLLFPGFSGPRDLDDSTLPQHVRAVVEDVSQRLHEQVSGALRYHKHVEAGPGGAAGGGRGARFAEECAECDARAREIVTAFIKRLPEVRRILSLDVQAAFDGDPAARHTDEVIFCYPGLFALSIHRLAHELYRLDVPLVPRIMAEHAHSITGIDLHPGAKIGQSFFIDHGTGVVIGETTVIGEHCTIYQGVTLGAKGFPRDETTGRLKRGVKRHPTLEDHVTVYAGATILGGDTTIGAGCVINGGVFLTQSVPPGHVVRGPKADIKLRANPEMPPANYAI